MAELAQMIAKLKRLDKAIDNALANEVADEVRKTIVLSAMEVVYSYKPAFDSRRMEQGGLIDDDNMIATVSNHTLIVENVTRAQDNQWAKLTPIVEEGQEGWNMPYPRPFMEVAEKTLALGWAENALRRGLARQGII